MEKINNSDIDAIEITSLYPPDHEKNKNDGNKGAAFDIILDVFLDLKATYPGELAELTGYCRDTITYNLIKLKRQGLIERFYTDSVKFDKLPGYVKDRVPSLWKKGIVGEQIKRRAWYILPENKRELAEKFLKDTFMD